jgi:hypothetical protein
MIAVSGGAGPSSTNAVITLAWLAPRLRRVVLAAVLAVSLLSLPGAAFAGETTSPADKHVDTIVFGLTVTQLAIAAAVGAGAGAAGALVSANVITGASLGFGTLGVIYVAHLAAEAIVVGGVYYWWPWETKPEDSASPAMVIRGADTGREAIPALHLPR